MSLYREWTKKIEEQQSTGTYGEFFKSYISLEKEAYEEILEKEQKELAGTVKELADGFSMDPVTFMGFLDGINTSLSEELDLEQLNEDSAITLTIDYEKLYYNMLKARLTGCIHCPSGTSCFPVRREGNTSETPCGQPYYR